MNTRRTAVVAAILVSCGAAGCGWFQKGAPPPHAAAPVGEAPDSRPIGPAAADAAVAAGGSDALMQADRDFAAATAAKGIEGWVAWFGAHGAQLAADDSWNVGPDAIRSHMKPAFADPSFRLAWTPDHAMVAKGGTLGWTWGRYRASGKDASGSTVVREGTYVTVWKKQGDAAWRAVFETVEPDTPATASTR
jgi:ketosteroid isomerase-like protein